jgi:integrase
MAQSQPAPHDDNPSNPATENQRRPRLLDQVRPPAASGTSAPAPRRPTSAGSAATSSTTRNNTPPHSAPPTSSRSCPWLAEDRHVSASTQNQALSALLFLYRHVLTCRSGPSGITRARTPARLPVVLSRDEVHRLLDRHARHPRLIAAVLYGAGLRLTEASSLRVKDLDFDRRHIVVRQAKGRKDRQTMLPRRLEPALRAPPAGRAARTARRDGARGPVASSCPTGSPRSTPTPDREWPWQFVFAAARLCDDPRSRPPTRFHLHESAVQRAVTEAVRLAGITKRASAATRSATRSPRICSRPATTSARCRNCSATPTSARR